MVIKFFESTYDSIKDRLKNPFFGTLLLVWIIRNREFLFNLLFNEKIDSEQRLRLLSEQFSGWNTITNFLGTISISLVLLALFYFSLKLSRFIVQYSERTILPKISNLFGKSYIVTREEFDRMESDRDYFRKRFKEERKERSRLEKEMDEKITVSDLDIPTEPNLELELGYQRIANSIKENNFSQEFESLIGLINSDFDQDSIDKKINRAMINFLLGKNMLRIIYNRSQYYYEFTKFGIDVRDSYLRRYS